MKFCPDCQRPRPEEEFGSNTSRPDGLQCYCKAHMRARAKSTRKKASYPRRQRAFFLFWKYGLTEGEFAQLMGLQDGKCAVCRVAHTAVKRPGHTRCGHKNYGLVVDHDHRTGVVRGLLCDRCNRAIGLLEDDAALLKSAADYLSTNGLAFMPAKRQSPSKIQQRDALVLQYRQAHPNLSATRLWSLLHADGIKVAKKTVVAVLRQNSAGACDLG